MSWSLRPMSGANFPPTDAWKVHAISGSLTFSATNLLLAWFLHLLWTSSKRHHHQIFGTSFFCFKKAICLPDRENFRAKMKSVWLWCFTSELNHVHFQDGLWWPWVNVSRRLLPLQNLEVWHISLVFKPYRKDAPWYKLDLHWYCTSAWCPIKRHAILCQKRFWNQCRHGTDSADVVRVLHSGVRGLSSLPWCSFLLWTQPVFHQLSFWLLI